MRVLVTGGAGFAGSHLIDNLLEAGHDVLAVDTLSTGMRENLDPRVALREIDIRSDLIPLLQEFRPEVIAHLAAQVSVGRSVSLPGEDLSINVGGTVNLVEAAARSGARKLIFVSSAAVYGNPTAMPITEETPTDPLSPYGLSKLTAERYIRLLCESRSLAYTILRPANIYGPRQVAEGDGAVIPIFLNRFLAGTDPVIHGSGEQTRDFIYVKDMVAAITAALSRADGLTLNVSTGQACSINRLWSLLAERTGWTRPPVHGDPRPGDIAESVMANERAKTALGWAPAVPLEAGLDRTVAATRTGRGGETAGSGRAD